MTKCRITRYRKGNPLDPTEEVEVANLTDLDQHLNLRWPLTWDATKDPTGGYAMGRPQHTRRHRHHHHGGAVTP
jgi:hypothetical protein